MKEQTNPYEELANAIVLQAVTDYRKVLKLLKEHPKSIDANRMKKECVNFFNSQWFSALTNLNGKVLLKKLDKEAA